MNTKILARRGAWTAAGLFAAIPFLAPPTGLGRTPQDDATAEVRKVVDQNCLMCHSGELIAAQRLTPKQWAATVDKMIGWGAPLPPEQKEAVVALLAASYPDKAARPVPATIAPEAAFALDQPDPMMGASGVLPKGDPARGAPLYVKHCATCHGPEAKGADLGTNLVEKPVLLREAEYVDLMRAGRRRMPGFAQILNPEAEADILAWLRGRKGL